VHQKKSEIEARVQLPYTHNTHWQDNSFGAQLLALHLKHDNDGHTVEFPQVLVHLLDSYIPAEMSTSEIADLSSASVYPETMLKT